MTTTAVEPGTQVPDMTLIDDQGNDVNLRSLAGNTVILYFYPKDDTPGCTTQACDIRDSWDTFTGRDDLLVYGVSPDSQASHEKFRNKYGLPFPLLVDEDRKLTEAMGFWVEKNKFGRVYMGVERSTVIVGPDGTISHVFRNVKAKHHMALLKEALGL